MSGIKGMKKYPQGIREKIVSEYNNGASQCELNTNMKTEDMYLAEKIRECQDKCGKAYGYRRVHMWLERNGM